MSDLAYYFDRIADEFNGYYTGRRYSFKIIGECGGREIIDVGCGPIWTVEFKKDENAGCNRKL